MIYFTEKQKFKQWWLWLILVLPFTGILFSILQNGAASADIKELAIGMLIITIIALAILSLNLRTEITEKGIAYKFSFFHSKFHLMEWENIADYFVREYKPIWEYGGWGLRYSFRNGKAFNTMGNQGLQIILKNGDKILIGTQKADELKKVIGELKKQHLIRSNPA